MDASTPPSGGPAATPAEPPTSFEDIMRVIGVTAMSNQTFSETIHRSIEGMQTEIGAIAAQARATARNVDTFVDGSGQQIQAVTEAATALAATAAQNQAAIRTMTDAVRAIETHITATPPSGGGPAGAGALAAPAGLWINEPPVHPATFTDASGTDVAHPQAGQYMLSTLIDYSIYRFPVSSKPISTEDVFKAEQKMSSLLTAKPPLRYDNRYSFQYNVDTFLLGIRHNLKRELREYWSANAMYEGSNANELTRMALILQWEELHYQAAHAGTRDGNHPVTSLDPETLVPVHRMVSDDLHAQYNSLLNIETYSHTPSYILPDTFWNATDEARAKQAAQKCNARLREPMKRADREFKWEDLLPKETQFQYRDYGVRYDHTRKRYVQNNPTFVGNTTAPSPENFSNIACAIGELFYSFLGPDASGRELLDCMPTAQEIMSQRHNMPNLFRLLLNEVWRTTMSTDSEKVRVLRRFREQLFIRFRPFEYRFRHAITMLQELNTELWKFGGKDVCIPESELITTLMERAIDWYRTIPEGERSGYFLGLQQLVYAWEKRDTEWSRSKANLDFKGVFKSLMSLLAYAVTLESRNKKDVDKLPLHLPHPLSSAGKFHDTPAPGTIMAMWYGDDAEPQLVDPRLHHTTMQVPRTGDLDFERAESILYGHAPGNDGELDYDDGDALHLVDRRPGRRQEDPYFGTGTPRPDAAFGRGGGGFGRGAGGGRGGRGGRGRNDQRQRLFDRAKRELQNTQRRDQQQHVRRSPPGGSQSAPPGAAGAGAHRRNEHPHSKGSQGRSYDWIPDSTYRGIVKTERSLSEGAESTSATVEQLRSIMRSCVADLRAARNVAAKPTALVSLTSGETVHIGDEQREVRFESEPHERVRDFVEEDGVVMPPDDGTDEGFTGSERTFLRTVLTQHPDARDWTSEQQEILLERAINDPAAYISLGMMATTDDDFDDEDAEDASLLSPGDNVANVDELDCNLEIAEGDHNPVAAAAVEDPLPSDGKPLSVDDLSMSSVSNTSASMGNSSWTKCGNTDPESPNDSEEEEVFVPPSPPRPQRSPSRTRGPDRMKPFDQLPLAVQRELSKRCSRPGCPCTTRAAICDSSGNVLRVERYCCRTCAGAPVIPGGDTRPGRPCIGCCHDENHRVVVVRRASAPIRPTASVRAAVSARASRN